MLDISAILIVYNEEAIIKNCLENIKDLMKEIIVVHDGECSDNTLEIARLYTDKIYIRPHTGTCVSHMPFCFEQATCEWVFHIDADEFLSPELKENLPSLIADRNIDAYEFVWPFWDGQKQLTCGWPRKRVLFRKSKISYLSLPHYVEDIEGKVGLSNLVLEHRPNYNNFTWACFKVKWLKWAKIHAELYLKDFSEIIKYNYQGNNWPLKYKVRRNFSLLILPVDFFLVFFKTIFSGGYKQGWIAWKYAILIGLYRVMVDYYIFKFKFGL